MFEEGNVFKGQIHNSISTEYLRTFTSLIGVHVVYVKCMCSFRASFLFGISRLRKLQIFYIFICNIRMFHCYCCG